MILAASALPAAAADLQSPVLQAPVQPACISSPFGWRRQIGNSPAGLHNGIDLPAPAGALVHAAAAGTIAIVKRQGLGGVAVQVRHADGLTTLYAHLGNLVPAVAEGQRTLAAGAPIGHVARTGVTYGTHVFFAVFRDGQAIDPEPLLNIPRCGLRQPTP